MMRKMVLLMAAVMAAVTVPAIAAERITATHSQECIRECQMQLRDCRQEVDSIQQRVEKLKGEIGKGTAVYTGEELKVLQIKLQDAQEMMGQMTIGG